jgi:hypothetical protein
MSPASPQFRMEASAPNHPRGRVTRVVATLILTVGVSVGCVTLTAAASAATPKTLVVTQRHAPYRHYATIQSAVDAAHPGDWILIDRGVYAGSVVITKRGLHLRGIDRNAVVIDGKHAPRTNGIEVRKADNVHIDNLTVRDFDRQTINGPAGNQIWWNGGDGSGRIGARGWWGSYLTAYDTGVLGGYGLFASNSVNGSWKHVYASGFADSGLYVGACRDCHAKIDHATAENNALGYSGTNAGGHLVVSNSTFRSNSVGIAPSSLAHDDLPPPQDGACGSGANRSPLPTFRSTHIRHCTIFRDNRVLDNNNLSTPTDAATSVAPWGVGLEWPGLYGDLVAHNTVQGNVNFGILAFEAPDPFPPDKTTIYFQLMGNRFVANQVTGNGTRPGGADIGLEGGAFGSRRSVNNCFADNRFATSIPAGIQSTWGCQHATTPNGGTQLLPTILALRRLSRSS